MQRVSAKYVHATRGHPTSHLICLLGLKFSDLHQISVFTRYVASYLNLKGSKLKRCCSIITNTYEYVFTQFIIPLALSWTKSSCQPVWEKSSCQTLCCLCLGTPFYALSATTGMRGCQPGPPINHKYNLRSKSKHFHIPTCDMGPKTDERDNLREHMPDMVPGMRGID